MKKCIKFGLIILAGIVALIIILLVILFTYISFNSEPRKANLVYESSGTIPAFQSIDIKDSKHFLNELMQSPMWKVEKKYGDSFTATARSLSSINPFTHSKGEFLFETMNKEDSETPNDFQVKNKYNKGSNSFSSFSIKIIFKEPTEENYTIGKSNQDLTLPIHDFYNEEISLNSTSNLIFKISNKYQIFLILSENGNDTTRATTFSKIQPTINEISTLINETESNRLDERYSKFYETFFTKPLKEMEIKRISSSQGRDTFYGYFRTKTGVDYNGINIKISHPIYCPNEGTRKSSRLRKAEYLGTPLHQNDLVFYMIEDNAIYLSGEFDEKFGVFTGNESFKGNLEVLNNQNMELLKTKEYFKGWQR